MRPCGAARPASAKYSGGAPPVNRRSGVGRGTGSGQRERVPLSPLARDGCGTRPRGRQPEPLPRRRTAPRHRSFFVRVVMIRCAALFDTVKGIFADSSPPQAPGPASIGLRTMPPCRWREGRPRRRTSLESRAACRFLCRCRLDGVRRTEEAAPAGIGQTQSPRGALPGRLRCAGRCISLRRSQTGRALSDGSRIDGEVPERSIGAVSKTVVPRERYRGFESLPLRHQVIVFPGGPVSHANSPDVPGLPPPSNSPCHNDRRYPGRRRWFSLPPNSVVR
jgi:hypothetical protein